MCPSSTVSFWHDYRSQKIRLLDCTRFVRLQECLQVKVHSWGGYISGWCLKQMFVDCFCTVMTELTFLTAYNASFVFFCFLVAKTKHTSVQG